MLALSRGDLAVVDRDGRRSAELFRRLGDRWDEMQTIPPPATLAEIKGDYDQASRCQHEQARRIAVEHGYAYGRIHAEMGLELGARRCGDLDAELGFVAELRGDADQSAALHLRGLGVARVLGDPVRSPCPSKASPARRSHAIPHGRRHCWVPRTPLPQAERGDVDRITAAARSVLGDSAFARAFEHGATRKSEFPR